MPLFPLKVGDIVKKPSVRRLSLVLKTPLTHIDFTGYKFAWTLELQRESHPSKVLDLVQLQSVHWRWDAF